MTPGARGGVATAHSLPALTGLRGLAALWVLLYHAWVYATPQEILFSMLGEPVRAHVFLSLGWAGVQVLFVLSGFLLTLPYARANAGLSARPGLGRYLLKRVARVFPAYYLQLLALALGFSLATGVLFVDWGNVLQYLLMLFVPPPLGMGAPNAINGVWWTLPIELSFYLALPLLAPLARLSRVPALLLCSMLGMFLWRFFVLEVVAPQSQPYVWFYQLPGSMDTFGLGMLGAVLHVHCVERGLSAARYRKVLLGLLYLSPIVFVALGMWMARDFEAYWSGGLILFLWTPLFGSAVLVVILSAALGFLPLRLLLANRAVFYLGTVSYGVYLWHPPIGDALLRLPVIAEMEGYAFGRLALLMLVASVGVASISWYLVEARAIAAVRENRG